MYKAELDNGKIIKHHRISDLCQFVIENPEHKYQFYIDYKPLNQNEFFKKILLETQDFLLFFTIYKALKKPITLEEYISGKTSKILQNG